MLRASLLCAAVLALVGTGVAGAFSPESKKTEWEMTCESVVVDTCGVSCPCLLGREPHHGYCRFLMVLKITKGKHGETSLDGVTWALFAEFKGRADKPTFVFTSYYIQESATEDQKKALKEIIGGAPFSGLGKPLGVTEVALSMTIPEEATGTYELKLGEKGSFTIVPLTGSSDPKKPIKVTNPVYPFPVKEITIGSAKGKFSDHGKDLELTDHSGEIGTFTISG